MSQIITIEKSTDVRRFETRCVHEGVSKDGTFNSVITPIYPSSTFYFDSPGVNKGYDYSRTANPTRTALEQCLAALEGGASASATGTGMAAEATVLHLLQSGAHVVAGHDIYGGTYRLFASVMTQRGLSFDFVDMRRPENVVRAIRPETRAVWIETPSNPLLNLVDIEAICEIARTKQLISIVDNTFMSPYFQKPFELGADIIVHSTTKYLNGHSDVVGGAIIARESDIGERVAAMTNAIGTCCSPFDAWLVLRGVKTLPCRMEVHHHNAMNLAEFLESRDEVEHVYYPGLESHPQYELAKRQMTGFGGMLSFDIRGGKDAAFRFIRHLDLFAFAESLGGVESLVEHPATMSHASMDENARLTAGITDSTIRVSVGIENSDDLITDVDRALTLSQNGSE